MFDLAATKRFCLEHLDCRASVVKRTQSIEIARSPEEVFAYLADPSKLSTWQDAEEAVQLTPGPLGVGSRLREVHKVLGRRRVSTVRRLTGAGTSRPRPRGRV